MQPATVRTLLSRLTEQLVLYFSEEGQINDSKEFADRLAVAAWEGLILLLRQSIANSDEVLLEEVGVFLKDGDKWIFNPAASLLEADAMKMPTPDEYLYLAQKAEFYLNQAVDLVANIPDDQSLANRSLTAEEKLLTGIFPDAAGEERKLSDRLSGYANQLTLSSRRLKGRKNLADLGVVQGRVGDYYTLHSDPFSGTYATTVERVGEVFRTSREAATRHESTVMDAIEAGTKAYREEKRKTDLSGRLESEASGAE